MNPLSCVWGGHTSRIILFQTKHTPLSNQHPYSKCVPTLELHISEHGDHSCVFISNLWPCFGYGSHEETLSITSQMCGLFFSLLWANTSQRQHMGARIYLAILGLWSTVTGKARKWACVAAGHLVSGVRRHRGECWHSALLFSLSP